MGDPLDPLVMAPQRPLYMRATPGRLSPLQTRAARDLAPYRTTAPELLATDTAYAAMGGLILLAVLIDVVRKKKRGRRG